eukprot:792616_1
MSQNPSDSSSSSNAPFDVVSLGDSVAPSKETISKKSPELSTAKKGAQFVSGISVAIAKTWEPSKVSETATSKRKFTTGILHGSYKKFLLSEVFGSGVVKSNSGTQKLSYLAPVLATHPGCRSTRPSKLPHNPPADLAEYFPKLAPGDRAFAVTLVPIEEAFGEDANADVRAVHEKQLTSALSVIEKKSSALGIRALKFSVSETVQKIMKFNASLLEIAKLLEIRVKSKSGTTPGKKSSVPRVAFSIKRATTMKRNRPSSKS